MQRDDRAVILSLILSILMWGSTRAADSKSPAAPHSLNSQVLPRAAEKAAEIQWLTDLPAASRALAEQRRSMILLLTRPGCTYCTRMKAETLQDTAVISRVNESFVAATLDGLRHADLTRKIGVRVYPTTAILSPEGRLLAVIHGYTDSASFLARLDEAKAKETARVANRQTGSTN